MRADLSSQAKAPGLNPEKLCLASVAQKFGYDYTRSKKTPMLADKDVVARVPELMCRTCRNKGASACHYRIGEATTASQRRTVVDVDSVRIIVGCTDCDRASSCSLQPEGSFQWVRGRAQYHPPITDVDEVERRGRRPWGVVKPEPDADADTKYETEEDVKPEIEDEGEGSRAPEARYKRKRPGPNFAAAGKRCKGPEIRTMLAVEVPKSHPIPTEQYKLADLDYDTTRARSHALQAFEWRLIGETSAARNQTRQAQLTLEALAQDALGGWKREARAHAVTQARLSAAETKAALLEQDRVAAALKTRQVAEREAAAEQRAEGLRALVHRLQADLRAARGRASAEDDWRKESEPGSEAWADDEVHGV